MFEDLTTYQIVKLTKAHRAALAQALVALGIHPGQEFLLGQLWREDGITQAELVSRLGVEAPTVTKGLQRLERAGFVRRERDPSARNARRVYLTAEGRALRRPVERAWKTTDRRLLAGLTTDERAQLDQLLSKLGGSRRRTAGKN